MRETPTYLNFDLLVERAGDGYQARVWDAPSGQSAPAAFELPFSELEIENFLLRIGRRRRGMRGSAAADMTQRIKTFGGQLYRSLFRDELQAHLLRSLERADGQGAGLRIRLRLSGAPKLADLPWEYLYDPARNRFLCLSDRSPLVRFLELPDPVRILPIAGPLRLLAMIANPADVDAEQLDVEREWTNLTKALADLVAGGRVEVERLTPPSLSELQRRLRRNHYHVLHFIGHGRFDPDGDDGQLLLEDQHGRGRAASGQELGTLLYDHRWLRLAVLNACEGARGGRADPFAGTAQSLVQQGIPAVVAMQFEISDVAAIAFSQALYEAIADGYPVDAATAEARKAIYAQPNPVEWATPVLYLRAPDGRIFDVGPPAAATAVPTAPVTAVAPAARAPARPKAAPAVAAGTPKPPATPRADPAGGWSSTRLRTFQYPPRYSPDTPVPNAVNAVAFSHDGRWLATASFHADVRVWDASSGRHLRSFARGDLVTALAFSPDDRCLVAAAEQRVRLWDTHSGQELRTLADNGVRAISISPDGRLLATASGDRNRNMVRIWDLQLGKEKRAWDPLGGMRMHAATYDRVNAVAFSPGGRHLATGADDHTVRIWDPGTGNCIRTLPHTSPVVAVAFSPPDGRLLATADSDQPVGLWDPARGERLRTLDTDDHVRWMAFSIDGRWLLTADAELVRLWDPRGGRQLHTIAQTSRARAIGPGGQLAIGADGNKAVLWKLTAVHGT